MTPSDIMIWAFILNLLFSHDVFKGQSSITYLSCNFVRYEFNETFRQFRRHNTSKILHLVDQISQSGSVQDQ